MLKIIYDLLVKNNIVVRETSEADYWAEVDSEIILNDFYHIQIGTNYLMLWACVPNVMSHRVLYEVTLDKLDNSRKVHQFINKVKTIYKSSADDLYDYSAE